MNNIVKNDILKVLDLAISIIEKGNVSSLKELSNHTIHNSSIFQDTDSVNIAIIMYTLAKIFERENKIDKSIIHTLIKTKRSLFEDKFDEYKNYIDKIFRLISKEDLKIKKYVQEVISQAGVRKGSKIYEHGISMAKSAQILGVSQWDMMDYVGSTKIADSFSEPMNLRIRLKIARDIFGI